MFSVISVANTFFDDTQKSASIFLGVNAAEGERRQGKIKMSRNIKKMGIAVGLMVLAILVAVALQVDDWSRDLTTNRAATSQDAADPLLRSLEVAASAEEIEEAIAQFVDRSVAWTANSNPTVHFAYFSHSHFTTLSLCR